MAVRMILAMIFLASGWPQEKPAGQKSTPVMTPYIEKSEQQFAFYPGGKLEIGAAAPGSFTIIGWSKAEMRVEMEKVFYYLAPGQAQELAQRYPVHITRTQTSAKITTTGSRKPEATMEVNFRVYVPMEKTDLNVKMIKGDLSLATMNGAVEVTLEEGNVEILGMAGYISILTKQGDLKVELSGKRWIGYGVTAATRKGSVDLSIPLGYAAALQLQAKDGKISLDYPPQIIEGESIPLQVLAKNRSQTLSAPIGGGGTRIMIVTVVGNMVVKGINRND